MPDDVTSMIKISELHNPVPSQAITLSGPMTILSSPPRCIAWHRASILGATALYGFVIAALPIGVRRPLEGEKIAEIEFVEVSTPAPATFDPTPPPASETAEAPTAEAGLPEVIPSLSPPEATSRDAEMAPPLQAPDRLPVLEPYLSPEPPSEAGTLTEPSPPQTTPSPRSGKTATPKLSRPQPRVTTLRPAVPQPKIQPADAASGHASDDRPVAATLTSSIRDAVQAAVQCPKIARMMDQSGKTGVAFDYRDGAIVGSVQIARSSGISILDAAALAAVRNAHYPQAPSDVSNQMLHLLIWVDEACGG